MSCFINTGIAALRAKSQWWITCKPNYSKRYLWFQVSFLCDVILIFIDIEAQNTLPLLNRFEKARALLKKPETRSISALQNGINLFNELKICRHVKIWYLEMMRFHLRMGRGRVGRAFSVLPRGIRAKRE